MENNAVVDMSSPDWKRQVVRRNVREFNVRSVACMDCRVKNSQNFDWVSVYLWYGEVGEYFKKPEHLEYCEHTPEAEVVLYKTEMKRCELCFENGTMKFVKERGYNIHLSRMHKDYLEVKKEIKSE